MAKPTAFISHISEEQEIAYYLKQLIDEKFLRSIETFASSHEESIHLGDEWLTAIKSSISRCGLIVVICSPVSVKRAWINFEAGAGWVRGIPVVPMCHSGMDPGKLPIPLNTLQGGLLDSQTDMQKLFLRLAKLADIEAPSADDTEFFERVHNFQTNAHANVLLKDSRFIAKIMHRNIDILQYCIYASTKDYQSLNTIDLSLSNFADYSFTFNDIHNVFNIMFLPSFIHLNKKVYEVIAAIVLRIVDTIRFIFSSRHIGVAPDLEELFNTFMYAAGIVDNWEDMIAMTDNSTIAGGTPLRNMMVKMIKEEPLPPTRKPSNAINTFIDYYDDLLFYKNWVVEYKAAIARLTGSGLTRK